MGEQGNRENCGRTSRRRIGSAEPEDAYFHTRERRELERVTVKYLKLLEAEARRGQLTN